jgi:hypothetical protein
MTADHAEMNKRFIRLSETPNRFWRCDYQGLSIAERVFRAV